MLLFQLTYDQQFPSAVELGHSIGEVAGDVTGLVAAERQPWLPVVARGSAALSPKHLPPSFAAREIRLGDFGEPEDIAGMATFLVSPRAKYITGAVTVVDGGLRRNAF